MYALQRTNSDDQRKREHQCYPDACQCASRRRRVERRSHLWLPRPTTCGILSRLPTTLSNAQMSSQYQTISSLPHHVGETVRVRGWVAHLRSSGKVAFVVVRDGSGTLQCVVVQKISRRRRSGATFNALTLETSVEIAGEVRADARAPGGFEIGVTDLIVLRRQPDRLSDPAEGARHRLPARPPALLAAQHRGSARSPRSATRSSRRSTISSTSAVSCASTRRSSRRRSASASGLFSTEYFDEGNAYLAQTGQLYGEAAAAAFGKIYTFGPTFRAEKSKTRRHLTEFWMIEPEVAWNDSDDNMRLQEDFVSYLVQRVLERRVARARGARARRVEARSDQGAVPSPQLHRRGRDRCRRRAARRSGATTSAPRTRRCSSRTTTRPSS